MSNIIRQSLIRALDHIEDTQGWWCASDSKNRTPDPECGCVICEGYIALNSHPESDPMKEAAPDLYAACEAVIEAWGTTDDDWLRGDMDAAIESALAALAKARGEGQT